LRKSNPLHADSDNGGYYDGEEIDSETALCGPAHPPYHTSPKLILVGSSKLKFIAASNQLIVALQSLDIFNLGGGTLDWSATASEFWIILGSTAGSSQSTLSIGMYPSRLTPGHSSSTGTLVNRLTQAADGLHHHVGGSDH
jgi:hypothetical protein